VSDCFRWLSRTADHLPHPSLIKIWQCVSKRLPCHFFFNCNSSITSSLYNFAWQISKSEAKGANFMISWAQKLWRNKLSSRFDGDVSSFVLAIMFRLKNKVKPLFESVWCYFFLLPLQRPQVAQALTPAWILKWEQILWFSLISSRIGPKTIQDSNRRAEETGWEISRSRGNNPLNFKEETFFPIETHNFVV